MFVCLTFTVFRIEPVFLSVCLSVCLSVVMEEKVKSDMLNKPVMFYFKFSAAFFDDDHCFEWIFLPSGIS